MVHRRSVYLVPIGTAVARRIVPSYP
jgi:hypothetical protein